MIEKLCRVIVRTFFRDVEFGGTENLPQSGPVIFTPNHPNGLVDPLLLFFLSPRFRIRFVAKAPLFKIPLLGSILRALSAIPVVRSFEAGGDVDYTTFFASSVQALKQGDSIGIFPEGRSLPQAYLAPLRTGPARLFFLARQQGIDVKIVPVGFNYERVTIFRSSVLVLIAPPVETGKYESQYKTEPIAAVRSLTAEITETLKKQVLQAENYRDRELMILLERLSSEKQESSWQQRFSRLKLFEKALSRLHQCCGVQIDRLRHMLVRYQKLSALFEIEQPRPASQHRSALLPVAYFFGWILALIGSLINFIPYVVVDQFVTRTRKDESEAATFKIVVSIFLFPATYILEAVLIARWLGSPAAIFFALLVIPITYFTVYFFEWKERVAGLRFKPNSRAVSQLQRLRERILSELDALARRPELQQDQTDLGR